MFLALGMQKGGHRLEGVTAMPILTHPAFGPRTAIIYITVGALIDVWTLVWYLAFGRGEVLSDNTRFWLWGFFLTGLTLILVGAFLGRIGRSARKVEMPPSEAVNAEATIQATAAANPPQVVTTGPAAGAAVPAARAPMSNVAPPANEPVGSGAQLVPPGVTRR